MRGGWGGGENGGAWEVKVRASRKRGGNIEFLAGRTCVKLSSLQTRDYFYFCELVKSVNHV